MQAEVNGLPCGDKERLVSIAPGVETGEIRSDVEEAIRDAIEFHVNALKAEGTNPPVPESYSTYLDVFA